jgi:DNA-binding LytR/AlgR family response regulator
MINGMYDFFFADVCGQKLKIRFKELVYVESAGNYVLLVGQTFRVITYKSMNDILEILDTKQFVRIHKSYSVSIDCINAIKGNECMLTISGKKLSLPIGVTFKKEVFNKLQIGK